MAKITITVEAGAQTYVKSRTLSAAHLTRLVSAASEWYADSAAPGLDLATDEGVLEAWVNDVFIHAKRMINTVETNQAAKGITDVDMA